MKREVKAALFDLDGVVFNTEPQYTEFWRSQCRLYHPEKPGLENQIKGQTLVEIYEKYFADVKKEQAKITERLNEFEANMHFDYVDGFLDFVADLRHHGVKTAVVTSSNVAKMNMVYAKTSSFKSLFDRILTSEDFTASKPDPAPYLKGAECFSLSPLQCVGFEDSFNGLKAVRGAGVFTVGLSTTNPEEAIKSYADIVIPNYVGKSYDWLAGELD
ncbi:HAD hydrolase, family IA, variant 3 [Segatella oris F0302]|uniref:HAD hydrolase, family IA, variant 3 n=1 Tax=Segatella oris F0302 TaxID=649760 RepID=D1QT81_9BACT|nr:HAD family phosphatase [Segatella oris]EFB31534.1 HAD hydrolase, family IA, variant 3 [Segatella oris F0302]MBF1449696.1 HAD family phosphatase [Segatella oris]